MLSTDVVVEDLYVLDNKSPVKKKLNPKWPSEAKKKKSAEVQENPEARDRFIFCREVRDWSGKNWWL